MKSDTFFAIAVIATFAAAVSPGARADQADGSQYAVKFEGSRTRAGVKAEAGKVAATRNTQHATRSTQHAARSTQHGARSMEPAGSRAGTPMKSTVDKQALRGQTAEAVRLGRISRGEVGPL